MLPPTRAAYYPHFEFGSTAWVKSALLFWEGLVRSRPPGSALNDDPELEELIAAGLIENVDPAPIQRELMPQVGPRLERLIRNRGGHLSPGLPGVQCIRGAPREWEDHARAELLESLRDYPLARKAVLDAPDQARALIFTVGAEVVARERRVAPVTDDPTFAAITHYFRSDGITDDPAIASSPDWEEIAALCLPIPSLEALAQLPVKRLLEIRKTYTAQRRHFRQTVQARVADIVQLETPEAVDEYLRALREEIRGDMEAAREAVQGAKVKERWSLLAIGTPMSVSFGMAAASGAPAILAAIEGCGAVALGITRWFTQKNLTEAGPESSYLLSLESALRPPWKGLGCALKGLVRG
jgi:hypothetical protein